MYDPLTAGFYTLSDRVNKSNTEQENERLEGVVSELTDELELSISDDDLISLKNTWEKTWDTFNIELSQTQITNESYWLGKQYGHDVSEHTPIDNLIFEAVETFLPIATRPKADPVVTSDGTEEGVAEADKVRKMITYWADNQSYNLKLKEVARHWVLYKLGCMKIAWSNIANDVTVIPIRPQKLILDPDATIDCAEYTGEYIGEYRKDSLANLIKRFPKQKAYLEAIANGKKGTKIQYIEWWTDDYVFWTLEDKVLAKSKNPHWNYETEKMVTDEFGNQSPEKQAGRNHFPYAKKPYVFLSIFSLGLRPFDDTSLVSQNIPLQDLINKRLRQIDKNADRTNGGIAVSGDSFTKEQAANVGKAAEKGGTIFVPNGDVNRAVVRLTGTPLPTFVYESLLDYRNELRNIFGTRGSTPQGTVSEQTVRGKMLIKGQDADRIGGGISTYLEQFSDVVFNWYVQMMYAYYNQEHIATIIGANNAAELIKLTSSDLTTKLSISVKDGSMIPKDPVSQRNEVIDLWQMGAIDPISFFEKLDFPDPRKSAMQLVAFKLDPTLLFPEIGEMIAQKQQPQQADPAQEKAMAEMELMKQKGQIDKIKAVQEMKNNQEKHQMDMLKTEQQLQLNEQKKSLSNNT